MIQLAKKTIHSQKTVFGTTIHTDENNRIVGTSSKGLFGEEVFLNSNGRFAGTKRKGILGEEHYFDKDGHLVATTRDGVLGTKITVDQNGKYMGTSYKGLGSDQIRSLSSMEKRMIRRSSILALLLVCSSLSSALSSLF